MIYILFTLIIVLSVFLYSSYVGVIKSRNQLDEALSGIDVQFKKRYELLPNILTIAQKFMTHEKAIFEEITTKNGTIFCICRKLSGFKV